MVRKTKKKKTKNKEEKIPDPSGVIASLDKLYSGGKASWVSPDEKQFDSIDTVQEKVKASTYGEITMLGASSVISKFSKRLQDPECVFYDLGCGLGRMVGQVALLSNVKKATGVELCPNRFTAANELADSIDWPATKPTFINGNFLEQDYSDATVVYVDNTMYKSEVVDRIESLLPKGCILIYQAHWMTRGDPTFPVETTYNKKPITKDTDKLFYYTYTRCAWRPAGGHEF